MKSFLILCALLIFTVHAYSSTYFFSTTDGDDSRSNSQARNSATPWKTLSKFTSLVSGDSALLKSGDVFAGNISVPGGTYIGSYAIGPKPIITTFVTASSWTQIRTGVYESNALSISSADVNIVTMDGKLFGMGRWPNEDASNGGYATYESSGTLYLRDAGLGSAGLVNNSWTGGTLVMRTNHFDITRKTITGVVGDTIKYGGSSYNSTHNGYGYFIQDHTNTLDQFGEWWYNSSAHKVQVFFGSGGPSSHVIKVASQEIICTLSGSNITFHNISFQGSNNANILGTSISNTKLIACDVSLAGIDGIQLGAATNPLIDSCNFSDINVNGANFYAQTTSPTIRNSSFNNISMHGSLIQFDRGGQCGTAIRGFEMTAVNNSIRNCGYIGIRADGNNVLIKNNYVDSTCRLLDDGGGIYTWVGSTNGTRTNRIIRGNICLNTGWGAQFGTTESISQGYCWGGALYLDDNTNNVTLDSNVVANCNMPGIYAHNTRSSIIRGNKSYNNGVQISLTHDGLGNAITGLTIVGNQFTSKSTSQLIMRLSSALSSDFGAMGRFDSNFYCRPLNESNIITRLTNGSGTNFSLATWQTAGYGYDAHTKKTPVTITNAADIRIEYTVDATSVSLDGTYITPDGITFNTGMLPLDDYSGAILFKTSSTIITPPATGGFKIFPGKKIML